MTDSIRAFPGIKGRPPSEFSEGMELRDYFAAHSLPALIEIVERVTKGKNKTLSDGVSSLVLMAYEIADAMIAAREIENK